MFLRTLSFIIGVLAVSGASAQSVGQRLDGPSDLPEATELRVGQGGFAGILAQELEEGEAHLWYLGHCGWAVKTRSRLLVFDYWEQGATSGERTLANGRIDPAEIRGLDVVVFVSHDHGDHYDPVILEWAQVVPNITYVFGWDAGLGPEFTYMTEERSVRNFGDLEIVTVNHRFDNIPEVAYLVKVDGLAIYHSGDHASTSQVPNQTFTSNIDFLADKQDRVDLAFISTFGRRGGALVNAGDLYTIENLHPRAAFPMHHGGGEDLNQRFSEEVGEGFESVGFYAALNLGDRFFYSGGGIRRTP